ncbi:hypothetical protein [Amycolatopsis australiensis]|uniref:Uncharacterized protein n=1 Tax=Amycolatopsis australiensis TaxID=546364 RepID=A0A1K1PFX3_9PSEU|nr:hypothetical protein [Amycolatopsis australiensis]SFW46484.1 hypothetical protein SAMN04489730_0579 [Amycolatopsis australiensis]
MQTVLVVAVLVVVAAVAAAIWWRSNTKFVESREEHWFKAFAAERGGTFHSGVGAGPAPTFGVTHPSGRPLAGSARTAWVEFRHRDHSVIAIDAQEPYRHFDGHTQFRDIHVTQVAVPPCPELRIVPGKALSIPTLPPDSPLEAALAHWLAANPRFAQRPVVVEHGSARTWGPGCATRQNIVADADYLVDLAGQLPAALWGVSGAAPSGE